MPNTRVSRMQDALVAIAEKHLQLRTGYPTDLLYDRISTKYVRHGLPGLDFNNN